MERYNDVCQGKNEPGDNIELFLGHIAFMQRRVMLFFYLIPLRGIRHAQYLIYQASITHGHTSLYGDKKFKKTSSGTDLSRS